ncbi:MAG: alkaline phosphatase family protein [Actinomycetota bacterium]
MLLIVCALVAASCTTAVGRRHAPAGAPTVEEMLRTVGRDVVLHLARGYVPDRSGEISLVPKPWNVIGQWPEGLRGPEDPRTTHPTPWSYHQRVPIILSGPGTIRAGGRVDWPVTVADLAPTFAEILDFPFKAPDGEVLREALLPRPDRSVPRLVVLVVQDGGGWNVLERWPRAWPNVRRLAAGGTTYTNATVGSAPSVTAPVHATMGTGAYPRLHGMPENTGRLPNGELGELFFNEADPRLIRRGSLADHWDKANGNEPWVGMLGFESWHLGMMGKGTRSLGGDRDVAVLWEREEGRLWTNERFYRLPSYLPGPERLADDLAALDRTDGITDGAWRGNSLESDFIVPGTPAFVDYMGKSLFRVLRREPIATDNLTDFLFLELKSSDYAGHIWNMEGPEVAAILRAQDRVIGRLVSFLDRNIGAGRYVLAVSADHGQTPLPETTGGLRIDRLQIANEVNDYFGASVIEAVHPDDVYLDMDEVRSAGLAVGEIARFLGDYRYRDALPEGSDPTLIDEARLNERVFAAAIPGSLLEQIGAEDLLALGEGRYPEGDLTSPLSVRGLLTGRPLT